MTVTARNDDSRAMPITPVLDLYLLFLTVDYRAP